MNFRNIFTLTFFFLFTACSGQSNKEQNEAAPNTEHRFEFKGCEAYYNGKKLPFLEPISEWVKIFGPYDAKKNSFFMWYDIPIDLAIINFEDSLVSHMAVVFGHSVDENDPYPKKFNGAILVDGVLIDRNSTIDEINSALKRNKPRSNRFTPFINSSVHFDRQLYDECNPEVVQNIYLDDNGEATLDSFNFSIAVTHLQGKTEN